MGEAAAHGRKSIGAKRNPESADAIIEAAEAVLREA
ncbi:MAG: TetR family transcriptional regulator, partial [Mesorhizobium sp.]